MWIGVLGPLRLLLDGEPVALGGARLRALIARLAMDAGRPIGVDALAEAVWPEGGPEHPAQAVHSLVARLRRALGQRSVVQSVAGGYRLDIRPGDVDVLAFEDLAARGRRALRDGDATSALGLARDALGLWRGALLSDVPDAPYHVVAAARLDELRLATTEDRIEAALISGVDPSETLPELEALVAGQPMRERPRVLLVKALRTQGRQAEALRAYEDYRILVSEELGTDPGPEMRDLHARLLQGDPTVARPGSGLRPGWTSLVGRDNERRGLAGHLTTDRLVTLVGVGGVGKTRLAATVAGDWAARRPGYMLWSVELASLEEPGDVPYAVASTAGVGRSGSASDVVGRLADAVSGTEALIVLDNCEHLLDPVAHLIDDLLGRCGRLRILATSREPLGITGEVLFPVRPLGQDDALALFTDRARAAGPGLAEAKDAMIGICRRLDGLPLAIELAAARLRSMSPQQLYDRLDDRFDVLTKGSRVAPERHRTLRAVVEWSWDLLDAVERDAIERLAVFRAGFGVEAAERLGFGREVLDALADKSLIQPSGSRYVMLDTIGEYGLEQLTRTDRLAAAEAAHSAYFLDLAERAEPHLRGPGQPEWIRRLDLDRGNLVAALRHAIASGSARTALRLGAVLAFFWVVHGDHAEAVTRLRPLLTLEPTADDDLRTTVEAGYLLNAVFTGQLSKLRADLELCRPGATDRPMAAFVHALRCLAKDDVAGGLAVTEPHLAEADPWTRAMLHLARAFLHGTEGESHRGDSDLRAAAEGFRAAGEQWGLALVLMSLASTRTAAGDLATAVPALDESMALVRGLGIDDSQRVWLAGIRFATGATRTARAELLEVVADTRSSRDAALARLTLADIARCEGDLADAADQIRTAEQFAAPGDQPFRIVHLTTTGLLATAQGNLDLAWLHFRTALDIAAAMPDLPMAAVVGVGMAELLLQGGRTRTAANVLGAADALRGGPDSRHPDVVRVTRDLRAGLGRREFEAEYARGRSRQGREALGSLQRL